MVSQEEFDKAAEDVKSLTNTPSNDELLELYSLYKQSTVGDCNTGKPFLLDFKGKAKWEAWNNRKGLSKEDAMNAYVEKVKVLEQAHGLKLSS